ncbi:division/cell wall cluster transcriptional repressor MraZ [Caldithrix abyssi]
MVLQDFAGEFTCQLDNKNRVSIPSGIRKMFLPEAQNTIVFVPGFEMKNVYAYPLNEWQKLTKKLRALNPLDDDAREFVRQFVGVAHYATMDGQGRVMIPDRILTMAGINKEDREMLLIGTLEKFEIWNPKVYEEHRSGKSLTELARLMQQKSSIFDNSE